MWHARGYGGYGKSEAVVVPGFSHALVTDCAWLCLDSLLLLLPLR